MKSYEQAIKSLAKDAWYRYTDGEYSPLAESLHLAETIAWVYELPKEEVKEAVLAEYNGLIGACRLGY